MTSAKHKFKIPIGDWSNDGHGNCDYFTCESDLPLEEVREAHFLIKEKTGINVGEICRDYEDSQLKFDVVHKLIALGFNKANIEDFDEDLYNEAAVVAEEEGPGEGAEIYESSASGVGSDTVCAIWVFLLNYANPNLNLKIVDDKIDILTFYGSDKKGRHIDSPGYGCFYL